MNKFILFLFLSTGLFAQTGIGTTTPDASAKLDVYSDNKGFLPPRVTLTSGTDNTTIASPATGLLVYNTGNNAGLVAGYYYWNGTSWATIATASGYSVGSSYMRGSRSTAQTTNLTTSSRVAFTQVDNSSGQEIALNTGTGQITLAAGRTYRLMAQVPNMSGGTRPAFAWYNETTSSWIGSQSSIYSTSDPASYLAFGSVSDAILTANSTTVVSYRIYSGSSLGSLGGNADFNLLGSYPWFDIQVISGNSAVNGQSVDYVSVIRTTLQTVNTGDNILFNSINSGNIPYNSATGNFTLTAGKTYRLTGSVSLDASTSASSEIDIAWKNASGDVLGNKALILSANFASPAGGNGITDIIYTPSVNTTIALNVIAATANAKTIPNYTYANVEQIGSSAIVNPWTLSGTSTYNTTGNVGIGTTTPTTTLDVTGNVNVTGKINLTDPTGNVATKVSGFVGRGVDVTLGLLKVRFAASGNMSLQVSTVSGTYSIYGSGMYVAGGNGWANIDGGSPLSVTTTPVYLKSTINFNGAGNTDVWLVMDTSNSITWRISGIVGAGYSNNFITIERLL
jgi:hypothetical protein